MNKMKCEPHYIYTIRPGDTLFSIAQRLGSSVDIIEKANFLKPPITDPGLIFPGQILVIPITNQTAQAYNQTDVYYLVQPADSLFTIGQRFSVHPDLLAGFNPDIQDPNLIFVNQVLRIPTFIYEIQEGDSLFVISKRLGIPLQKILQANAGRPGLSPDVIYPQYLLIIPYPSSRNLVVFRPFPGQNVMSGEPIEGLACAFDANVLHQVRDDNDVIVFDERFTTAAQGAPA